MGLSIHKMITEEIDDTLVWEMIKTLVPEYKLVNKFLVKKMCTEDFGEVLNQIERSSTYNEELKNEFILSIESIKMTYKRKLYVNDYDDTMISIMRRLTELTYRALQLTHLPLNTEFIKQFDTVYFTPEFKREYTSLFKEPIVPFN